MIWFTIALFVVSFLVTALLAPKPDIEDARAGSLDDIVFPRASEDAPIPLALGKVRINSPNTLWYGGFFSEDITERIRTGLFSKKTIVVGHRYYLTLDLGLCIGPDVNLREVWIDEELVWEGTSTTAVADLVDDVGDAEMFGGHKGGGGFISNSTGWYPGTFPQAVDTTVEDYVGAGGVPGYGGLAHIVMRGAYIGESNQLRKMGFVVERYTNGLASVNAGRIGTEDINPMEALYQIFTLGWGGLDISVDDIDVVNWLAVAQTLYDEDNGCSILVTKAQNGSTLVKELLRQIDAILFQDPTTGKIQVKLIRDDYDVRDLPVYDEDDITLVRSFTKTTWEDVVAQVKVSFPSRTKESSIVAISMDGATASMLGRLKTVNMSFPFCYDPDLANRLASRERAQASVPLFRMTLEMNRNGYTLKPGQVFKLSWPEYGFEELVMRVQKHDLGALLSGKIVIDCIQDSFGVGTAVFAVPTTSAWVAPVNRPADITTFTTINMPTFFALNMDSPVPAGNGMPLVLPQKPQTESGAFSIAGDIASGSYEVEEPADVLYPPTGVLRDDLAKEGMQQVAGWGVDTTTTIIIDEKAGTFPETNSTDQIYKGESGIMLVGTEWIGFQTATNGLTSVTISNLHRGLFGTTMQDHAADTRVYVYSVDDLPDGVAGQDLVGGDTFYYRPLDTTAGTKQDPAYATEQSFAVRDETRYPLRPRQLQLEAQTDPAYEVTGGALDLTWFATDRETGAIYPTEFGSGETPPETTTYDIYVFNEGVEQVELRALNQSGLTYSVPFDLVLDASGEGEFHVYSRIQDPDNPGVDPDYISAGFARLVFTYNVVTSSLLLEGDEQSGTDKLLLEGDEQSGTDILKLEGDEA